MVQSTIIALRRRAPAGSAATHKYPTGEVSSEDLRAADQRTVSTDPAALAQADFIVIAAPTPVDSAHQPDLAALYQSIITAGVFQGL